MNAAWLPLVVALPLLASALTAAAPWRVVRLVLLLGTPLATAVVGVWLIGIHRETPVLATNVGGFPVGIAIPFVSDTLSAVLLAVTGIATFVVLLFALRTGEDRLRFFPALVLMLIAGVNGAFLTGDIFNLFVFVEVMLLPSYALLAMSGTWRRLGVGRLFLVVNLVTSSVFLVGIALLYAAAGTVNLALEKAVTSSDDLPVIGEVEMITDGDKDAAEGSYVELGPFLQHVTIDLGQKSDIYAIVVWHFHKQPRVYFDVIVQVADDADFITNVHTLFNNDHDNSAGLGVGKDKHYVETSEGRLIDAKGVQARYVRLYSNGNTGNDLNHYIEVEVHGKPSQ